MNRGVTLVEALIGSLLLSLGIATLLNVSVSQTALQEHTRNLSWATNDANRVLEQLRQQNAPGVCPEVVNVAWPAGFASWDDWLGSPAANGGGGKSITPNPATDEWVNVGTTGTDPVTVTVSVCWRHRNRILGDCQWNGTDLDPDPAQSGDPAVVESLAMLSTSITCRQ